MLPRGAEASRSSQPIMTLRFAQSLGTCDMSKGGRCTIPAQPTMVIASNAINNLFITIPMFDFAVIHCPVLFNLWLERSVTAVQLHRTAALFWKLNSKRQCFHVCNYSRMFFSGQVTNYNSYSSASATMPGVARRKNTLFTTRG